MAAEAQAGAAGIGRVRVDGVAIRYRGTGGRMVEALSRTDLVLEPGTFTSLVGPSGCGKSTLLNAVAGFVDVAEGRITVDDETVTGPDPEVGVVFQQYALFPWFTASDNVGFALKRFGLKRAERRARAAQALEEVGLAGRGDSYPGQLSGGMKQRVALARTLASRPKVLLMDEPFGALDAQTRVSMHELLLGVWERHRTTVLFVTHDIDEALLLSDRVHIMSAGPGRVVDTMPITSPRPRRVDAVDGTFVADRNHIARLLRHGAHP